MLRFVLIGFFYLWTLTFGHDALDLLLLLLFLLFLYFADAFHQ